MELKVNPKELGTALRVSGGGELVQIRSGAGSVELASYFNLQWFRMGLSAEVVSSGSVMVRKDRLTSLLNSLTGTVTIKLKGTKAIVSSPTGTYQLMTFAGEVPIPSLAPAHQAFDVGPLFAAELNRVLISGEMTGDGYSVSRGYIYSSDRVRILSSKVEGLTDATPFIIPKELAKSFTEVLSKASAAEILVSDRHIVVRCHCSGTDYEIGGSTIAGRFPDVDPIIAKAAGQRSILTFKRDELREVIGRIQKVYEPTFVDLSLSPTSCSVSCLTEDGNAAVELEASSPETGKVRLQTTHTLDFLSRTSNPEVTLRWSQEILLWSEVGRSFSLVTTPGRIE